MHNIKCLQEMIMIAPIEYAKIDLLQNFDRQFEIIAPLSGISSFRALVHFSILIFKSFLILLKLNQECRGLQQAIRNYYFGSVEGKVGKESFDKFITLMSDIWFKYAIDKSAKYISKKSKGKTFHYV